ncbi:MAG: hypothetical protein A2Y12_09400 [Planctomycetes bacterium GWF2_42_9]|nr:MAG: hypothetical protein A2Y12_09400 [Planctomycetes bacterium GWF2_42_9]
MQSLNTIIVGAGARSIAFCKYIKNNPDITCLSAVVDTNLEKAQALINHFDINCLVTADLDLALTKADVLLIATPDFAHVQPTITAIKAGKHVYIEKPLATTVEDCNLIINAAKNCNTVCYLGFNMRHSAIHERIHELVHSGALGKVTTIEANEWYYGGRTYFRRWNRLRKFGGGLWLTKACHDFDLLMWIAGQKPVSIYANSGLSHYKKKTGVGPRCRDCVLKSSCHDYYDINKPIEHWFDEAWRKLQLKMDQSGSMSPDICLYNSDKDTFDNGIAVIEFENDIRATYTVNVLSAKTTRQIRVIGTDAVVEGATESGLITLTERHSCRKTLIDVNNANSGTHNGADQKILTDFFTICRNGGNPRSSLIDGKMAVQLSLAATLSDDEKRVVTFDDLKVLSKFEAQL